MFARASGWTGKITANLAWFYNPVKDYQVERSITTTDYAVFNAENARIYGVELSRWTPPKGDARSAAGGIAIF